MTDMQSAALALAAEGFRVFPLPPGQKAARLPGWQKKATVNPEFIETHWTVTPAANIGIATGVGLLVLDEDPRAGSDLSMQDLALIHDALPETRIVRTPSGGRHRYFRVPEELRIANSVSKLGAGLDIRGDGGYVAAPPSVLVDGPKQTAGVYTLETDSPIADAPEWLTLLATTARAIETTPTETGPALIELTVEQIADIKSALWHPALMAEAASNDTWSEIGYALRRHGAQGRELWLEFSEAAPKGHNHTDGAAEAWWQTHPADAVTTDYRHIFTMAGAHGWENPATGGIAEASDFDIVEPDSFAPPAVGEVPRAGSLCTDLRNAGRLRAAFGAKHLIAVDGRFYVWERTHWQIDENAAERCAAQLPALVRAEAQVAAKHYKSLAEQDQESAQLLETTGRPERSSKVKEILATAEGAKLNTVRKKADALARWATRCEMRNVRVAALTDLRKMCTVERNILDANPDLAACENGTLNLRTGELSAHNPADLITKLCPVAYKLDAKAPRFEKFMREVLDTEDSISFLQRWLGYGLTGQTREQVFLIATGAGSNGKGTLVRILKDVLGDHHSTAPGGLLTAGHTNAERHPTELASLEGYRLVTVHEPDQNQMLRESLLKQLTGEDEVSARKMREDFKTFDRVPKLQILCNTKPKTIGTDRGLWRRVLVLDFPHKFGTAADIVVGDADRLIDTALGEALRAEREGIFAWLVRGAMQWYRSGLQPPKPVLDAAKDYQRSQDKTYQFLTDRYELNASSWSPFDEVYESYSYWCRESGFHPLNKSRLSADLARVVPAFRRVQRRVKGGRPAWGFVGLKALDKDGDICAELQVIDDPLLL